MSQKLRLGFYMFTPEIGGAEKYLRDLLWSLDRTRYDITLFYEPWPVFEQFLGLDYCPPLRRYPISVYEASLFLHNTPHLSRNIKRLRYFINYYFWQFIWAWPNYWRLWSAFAAMPVDVLHISNGGYPGANTALLAGIAAKAAGVPTCIMTVHGIPTNYRFLKQVENNLNRRVEKAVDQFIAVSRDVGQGLEQKHGFPTEKIKVIYNGINPILDDPRQIDKVEIRRKLNLSPTKQIIGMVARLSREKGHEYLFQALAQLRQKGINDFEVILIGDGPLMGLLKRRCVELGLEQMVKFVGRLPYAEVLPAMAACDILTLLSETEGLGYVIIEAMSVGKPVIGAKVGGIPELIVDGKTGLLVSSRDPKSVADALWYLVHSPDVAAQMGQNAYQRFCEHFTFKRMLQDYEALYQSLYQQRVIW